MAKKMAQGTGMHMRRRGLDGMAFSTGVVCHVAADWRRKVDYITRRGVAQMNQERGPFRGPY
jgi:hypothetical protein